MPGGYAHMVITDSAMARYLGQPQGDPSFKAAAQHFPDYIRLGCVSPDYPSVDVAQPPQPAWADRMHYEHTGDLVQRMVQRLLQLKGQGIEKPEFAIPYAWTMGYIAHVTADLVIHPIVRAIVGDYKGHELEHCHCEMIQDAYIYKKQIGVDIQHDHLMHALRNCSDPADSQKIHPILRKFWNEALRQTFPAKFDGIHDPDIDVWHSCYADILRLAGRPAFLGRLDPKHKFTYKKASGIAPDERKQFLEALPLPSDAPGTASGTYDRLFEKAVGEVVTQWELTTQSLGSGNLGGLVANTPNCDLVTGEIRGSSQLKYWA
jgi:Zinc dependent phospholipase C